jgi:hypothetical protein
VPLKVILVYEGGEGSQIENQDILNVNNVSFES